MNHPKREAWVPLLYGEANRQEREQLVAHLKSCPECQAEFGSWQKSLRRLDTWKLPRTAGSGLLPQPLLKWGLVGACLLMLGFIAGSLSVRTAQLERVRAGIEPQLRQELKAELTAIIHAEVNQAASATLAEAAKQNATAIEAYTTTLEAKRSQDYQALHTALLVLKEQLDTVAMNTDAGFRQAERKLVQLADYKEPSRTSTQP